MPVEVLIDENDTINAIISADRVSVEIIAKVIRLRDSAKLEGLHLELLVGGPLVKRQIDLLCDEFCRYFELREIFVHGARRTTGKSAGRVPRPIHYRIPD